MNIKIINSTENKLIGRREIDFEVEYEKIPKREEILELLSKTGQFNKELLTIKKMDVIFGIRKLHGIAYEYTDKERMNNFEPKYRIKRWKIGKEEEKGKEEQKTKQ